LYTYSIYNDRGKALAAKRPLLAKYLKSFAILSMARRISQYLDTGIPNNWTNDSYNWSREVVVVTGGSDGIGAIVVQLLAERGVKVVILDIQAPKYECKLLLINEARLMREQCYLMFITTTAT
jgi:3-oxoacyl-ACP reductase-like protein